MAIADVMSSILISRSMLKPQSITEQPDAAISLQDAARYLGCCYRHIRQMVYHPERVTGPILESLVKPGSSGRRQTTRAMCDRYRQALESRDAARPRSMMRRRSVTPDKRMSVAAPLGAPALSPLVGPDLLKSIGF